MHASPCRPARRPSLRLLASTLAAVALGFVAGSAGEHAGAAHVEAGTFHWDQPGQE